MTRNVPKKVLLVDDCVDFVDLMKIELEAWGYMVEPAYDGDEGLQKASDIRPDLILLDIMMPGLNGFEVLKILKGDPLLDRIPVIIISAKEDEKSKSQGKRLGASEYLGKSELAERLEDAMKRLC